MVPLVLLGLLSSAFFSSTFVLNRAMSLSGGHWVWSGSLRYVYMLLILAIWLGFRSGPGRIRDALALYRRHILFWTVTGTVGFGVFYSLICFAADHAPAWIVAATWQLTILATPVVLAGFGNRVPGRGVFFAVLVFSGIVLVNLEQRAETVRPQDFLLGALPVLVAAFAYPTGNQMLNAARHGGHPRIPHIASPLLRDAPTCVLLMTLGSLPFWAILVLAVGPPPPEPGQWTQTALVALLSGVVATSIFYKARNATRSPYALAAVDATQAGEVVFSLLGEVLFLGGTLPGMAGSAGLVVVLAGLVGYSLREAA